LPITEHTRFAHESLILPGRRKVALTPRSRRASRKEEKIEVPEPLKRECVTRLGGRVHELEARPGSIIGLAYAIMGFLLIEKDVSIAGWKASARVEGNLLSGEKAPYFSNVHEFDSSPF